MASGIYERFKANLMGSGMNLNSGGDTNKVILLDTNHAFTATQNTLGQISGNELPTSGGYTVGGQTLAGQSVTQEAAAKFDATDIAWTGSTFTAMHAAMYDFTIATKDLNVSLDFGGGQTVTAGTFTIQWNASGIITLT